ncbi:MAG: hypothetical protein KGI25_09420 [Thaumarchaeota archaeon]|nr:hypothetical protein [Nitrososphaerota archaeon]
MGLEGTSHSEELKSVLHENCTSMIQELQDKITEMMNAYKQNPTFPFDFYNLSLRESDIKISGIRELYKRITNEEL